MAGGAAHHGETGAAPTCSPASIDGLDVVAAISLVDISGRIRATATPRGSATSTASAPVDIVGDMGVDVRAGPAMHACRAMPHRDARHAMARQPTRYPPDAPARRRSATPVVVLLAVVIAASPAG